LILIDPVAFYDNLAIRLADLNIVEEKGGDIDIGQVAEADGHPLEPFQPGPGVDHHPIIEPPQRGYMGMPINEDYRVGIVIEDRLGRLAA
jgi:hypothetical protein